MNGCFLIGQESATDAVASSSFQIVGATLELVQTVNGRIGLAILLGTLGLWMLMPGRRKALRLLGGPLAIAGALCALSLAPVIGGKMQLPFSLIAGLTLAAAVAAVTARSPVYAAVWFAGVLLGTGGLFLINGAQFLGIATVAVYAGAIVVTFLFVLMLAQPEGHDYYDRVGWGRVSQGVGCLAGMLVSAAIIWAVMEPGATSALTPSGPRALDHPQHVATLGGQLFTRHLVAVQAAGAMLLAALVGAVAIAGHGVGVRGLETRMTAAARPESTGGGDA